MSVSLSSELATIIQPFAVEEGFNESPVPGVFCVKYSETSQYTKRYWRACLAIIAQGCKEVVLGNETFWGNEAHYSATPIHLPVISRVASASHEKPFLGVLIDLNPFVLNEVANQIGDDFSRKNESPARALFRGKAGENMMEAAIRLVKLFQTPEDARVLGQLVVKELLYHLLKGTEGAAIRQYVHSGSKMQKICQAVHALKSELNQEIDVTELAKTANMSRSAFFKSFKEITSMSPIQYQKRLRLLEAKRLMIDEGETAESSAFRVGYKSASQFSREYSRMFGNAPLRDVFQHRM